MVSLPRDHKAECPQNKSFCKNQKTYKAGRFCAKIRQKPPEIRLFPSVPILPQSVVFPLLPKTFHTKRAAFSDAARFCPHIFLISTIQIPLLQYVPIAGFIRTDPCKEALDFEFGKGTLDSPLRFPDGICQFGSRKSAVFTQVFQHLSLRRRKLCTVIFSDIYTVMFVRHFACRRIRIFPRPLDIGKRDDEEMLGRFIFRADRIRRIGRKRFLRPVA